MNNDFDDDHGRFNVDMSDDIEPQATALNASELRLEKISQRVTFISILIPVLVVIVLVITYLDVKKRMSYTQDTGTMEFQKLSANLESRFGSLSMQQAKLEEAFIRLSNQQNKSAANSSVKLNALEKTIKGLQRRVVVKKDFEQVQADLNSRNDSVDQQIKALGDSVEQAGQQVSASNQAFENQIAKIDATLAAADLQLQQLQAKIAALDTAKVDQASLDVKIKLSALRLQQEMKAELEAMARQLKVLEKKISSQAAKTPAPAPAKPTKPTATGIVEQPLKP